MRRLSPLQTDFLYHRRHEEQGHQQRDAQVDNHHRRKVLQVQAYLLVEEEDDDQRPDGGQRGRQHRHERLQVAPSQDMVGHDDDVVYHQVQRDGDARQRIKLDFQPQRIIQDDGHGNVHRQPGHYQEEIPQVARNHRHEQQQDQHGDSRTEINRVQLLRDVFRGIIARMDFVSGRHHGLRFGYHLPDLLRQGQLVGRFRGGDGQIHRVQPVDAVVRCGLLLRARHPDQPVQRHHAPVGRLHRNLRGDKPLRTAFGGTHQPYPFRPVVRLQLTNPQKLTAVPFLNGGQDILYPHPDALQLHIVVHDAPLHGRGTAQLHLIHPVQCRNQRLDVFLAVLLYHDGRGGSVQRVGHERTRGVLVAPLRGDERIAHPFGKLRPQLPDKGGHLKAGHPDIRMAVQLHVDAPAPVVGSGTDATDAVHPGQHALQTAGDLRLHHPGRIARHGERHRQPRHVARRRELHRQQRRQRQSHQRQAHERHYQGE